MNKAFKEDAKFTLKWLVKISIGMIVLFFIWGFFYQKPCDYRTFSAQVRDVYKDMDQQLFTEIRTLNEIHMSREEIADKIQQNITTVNNVLGIPNFDKYVKIYGLKDHYGVAIYTYPSDKKGQELSFFLPKRFKKGDYINQCQNTYLYSTNIHPEDK